ncbi:MAG: FAD-binding oxidoreductase [Piscirickettsiaceae bacterium]|nr:MAG: FAD-binding oxidoreductase [Piscirickettsiaceae bacterium]
MENIIQNLTSLLTPASIVAIKDSNNPEHQFLASRINNAEREAIAVVSPTNLDELKTLLVYSAEQPFSLFNLLSPGEIGTAAIPSKGDVVVIDLQKMNSILEVNQKDAYALIEPGVTYGQLNKHLEDNNIPFVVDVEKGAQQSVLGSICNRNFGYTPYGDQLMMQCGMEVMLADGSLVRTGMGAMPKSNTWQLFKYGYGPYMDGLFTQSNMGIVTKIGLWLMPKPPAYKPFMLQLPNDAAMEQAVEILRSLKINMLVPNTVVIASAESEVMQFIDGGLSSKFDNNTAEKHQLGRWNIYGALYGIPGNVDVVWGAVEGALGQLSGAKFLLKDDTASHLIWAQREKSMLGQFNQRSADLDDHASINLHFASPIEGKDALAMQAIISKSKVRDLKLINQLALTWRTLFSQINITYPKQSADKFASAKQLANELIQQFAEQGYSVSFADADMQDSVDETRDAGLKSLNKRVKKALDPQHNFG